MNDIEQMQWETLVKVAPMLDDDELSALCYGCGFQYREVRFFSEERKEYA